MDFEPVNVHGNPAGKAEMERLGIPLVPATVVGERFVHGWNPAQLAELVGVPFDDTPALSPQELADSLDNVLYYAQHLCKALTADQLELKHPQRDRVLRNLAFHIFRLGAAFVDSLEQNRYLEAWIVDGPPPELRTGADLEAYGEQVRERLRAWFAAAPADVFDKTIPTYYGEQWVHLHLERTTWHSGQHLRQAYDLLERDGSLPVPPLAAELFEGLPMPAELW